jgi:hypothetical protein
MHWLVLPLSNGPYRVSFFIRSSKDVKKIIYEKLFSNWRMPSSGMLCRVNIVGTNVSEERSASIITVPIIGDLGTLPVTSNRRTLRRNISCQLLLRFLLVHRCCRLDGGSAMFLWNVGLTRATRHYIPEGAILHSHCRENNKSYILEVILKLIRAPISGYI